MTAPLMTFAGFGPMTWDAGATIIGACATFFTGVLAVVAAIVVGWRQSNIAVRQSIIAEKQTAIIQLQSETDRVRLRAELFERRMGVYSSIRDILMKLAAHKSLENGEYRKLFNAVSDGQFLFSSDIFSFMERVVDKVEAYVKLKEKSDHIFGGPTIQRIHNESAIELEKARLVLDGLLYEMHPIFRREIHLDAIDHLKPPGFQTDNA